ncbi:amino acid adenylation domain-containing protein [Mycobacterium sp. SMC-2]|uniref:non-ribosomal peptide synthetase n=1 Tax=Mycobacterium sp. SMC-2 TaxID=2857058 RepID=UPI0021B341FA|nr:non-ribosomal peptide synthetase [Mycobacterium sp. SMC-2]UXA07682.1 amino acid adenylation domain-containing protein [Mycobacterium sp. SMC-2]
MTDQSVDISGLSPEKKRALLSQLLMEEAEEAASVYPMSYGQRSMWFIHKLAPASTAYTVTYAGRIRGELDVPALERAAQALVDRHPMLRTTYGERDGQPVQLVHPHWPVRIARHHLGPGDPELDEWIRRETDRPFDLYTGPVLRLTLLERTPEEHVLLLGLHHIAVDFWSIDVILDELRLLYAAEHGAAPPAPPAESFVEYADQQTRMLAGAEGEDLWAYWREQLAGDLPLLQLPTDRPRPAVQTYPGTVHRFTVDETVTDGIKQLGRSVGATPYMTLLAAYATLLHRYSGQGDLVVGSPFACRDRVALEGLVGYLTNPVALRADLHDDPTFTDLLGRVKETVQGALAHQDYPFALLVERLRPVRDPGRTPLFQVSFAWEQTRRFSDGTGPESGGLRLETLHVGQGGAPFDLMMEIGEHDGKLSGVLQYNTDLFDAATIERMAGHFATLLGGIVADPGRRVSQLPLLTEEERRQRAAWNQTEVVYDGPACLHEMVEATVARVPDAVAVMCDDRELTYAELDRRANGLARRLQQLGVGPEIVVPVLLDRSEDLVVALLGVLKAGGAFMPLDSAQPAQRMATMLDDVPDAPVCVTHQDQLAHLPPGFTGHRLCLDVPSAPSGDDATAASIAETVAPTRSANLAYVIHTSGSTGKPKGTLNTHAGIRNRLLWMQDAYRLTADDRVLHKTPVSFDPSVWELFWPLIVGARLVIAKPEGHKDAAYLVRTIVEQAVTTMHFVPSMMRRFLAEPGAAACTALRQVFCSGEALPYDLRDRFLATLDAELYNLYGPTEAAIDVTGFHCQRGESGTLVPIGRPIANIRAHILDAHLQPVPVGVPGELFIGGVGLGRGYLGRPDLTASIFVADPFGGDPADPGQRLYRTGDLTRYLPDGNIDYLGRIDFQVKIHGFRIEPGEVEAALSQHPAVAENAVVIRTDSRGNPILVAYVVPAGGAAPTTAELRRFLIELLPAAMVPAVFEVRDALPLTSSGKVDRKALMAVDSASVPQEPAFVAPRTRTEQVLAEIWCAVMGLERVGVNDDFFALGGASTQSLEVAVRANAAGLPLRPESMFVYGTIAELAAEYGPIAGEGTNHRESPAEVGVTAPAPEKPVQATTQEKRNTVIESIGVYLPARTVSTKTVMAECANEIRLPLERLTGIKNRRVVGEDEFSIDIARKAADDCLSRSSYRREEIDLVIACNISRRDGLGHRFTLEPSTASRLRDQCGFANALAFDISNACAGMFTGITVADAFLQTGLVRNALVVSGEYISHLTETAQKEIEGPMDPRLACLTLGDAGAAVILERGPNGRVGFHDIDIATFSRYCKLCIAKATEGPHGGAIMFTDSVTQTAIAVKHAVPYVAAVMQRHGWRPETCDHLLMHQTSEASLNDAVVAINQLFGPGAANRDNTIYNVAERGNTASTTHFVALYDYILSNRIKSGDNVVFSITGSGQTIGAALYTFDDLPDRMRRGASGQHSHGIRTDGYRKEVPATPRVRIDSVGIAPVGQSSAPSSIQLAVQAAAACLDGSSLDRAAVDLIIHAGIYRDDFLSEPAVASLVAGELGINGEVQSPDGPKTLAFDVLNGAVGFLNACHVAAGMIGAGKAEHAMVVASEAESNSRESGYPLNGISQTGSAILLSRSDGTEGFGRFIFQQHPEHSGALATYTQQRDGRCRLQIERDPNLAAVYLSCIPSAAKELLTLEGLDPSDIAVVLSPQLSTAELDELAAQIGIPRARFVEFGSDDEPDTDLFTSSLPYGMDYARRHMLARPGDIALILTVGSGVTVGCTTYRF